MSRLHCLVVEGDGVLASALSALIASEGWSVSVASTIQEARRLAAMQPPDLVFSDLGLPGNGAWVFLRETDLKRDADVVVTTREAAVDTVVTALRLGAVDYLVKPFESALVRAILNRCAASRADTNTVSRPDASTAIKRLGRFVGRSEPMLRVLQQIRQVAPTSVSVMLFGESGTGKEVAARTIHELSARARHAFLAVNCGAVSPTLMESEFFGHEKGSFTGADKLRHGYFEQAQGGTLFLDEVTEMPIELQPRLLRVLEMGTILRVGSSREQPVDVRIVSATNRRVPDAIADGALRLDLLYRLNVFPIHLPPLRERGEDILLIAEAFLQDLNNLGKSQVRFSDTARATLMTHSWPGNVRELRNVIQRAYVMSDGSSIRNVSVDVEVAEMERHGPVGAGADRIQLPVGTSIADAERALIEATLRRFNGQKEKSAVALGISLKTLYNRLRTYGNAASEDRNGTGKRNCQ